MRMHFILRASVAEWLVASLTSWAFALFIYPAQADNSPPAPTSQLIDIAVDESANTGQTTENALILSTTPAAFGTGLYRVTVNFAANVCPKDGVSPIVLNVLKHRDNVIIEI